MKPRTFLAFAAVTAATVVAAAVSYTAQPEPATVTASGEPAFPGLDDRINDVARIVIADKDGKFALARADSGAWVAEDKFGYPADEARIRELVLGLADLHLAEAKTSRPERYDRLEVQDIDAAGAKSRLVRLESGEGETLAEVLIGKQKYAMTGGEEAGTYIRLAGAQQAWLAAGEVAADGATGDWLVREVVSLPSGAVRRIEIKQPDGGRVVAHRDSREDEGFAVEGVPEGREVDPAAVEGLASGLSLLEFEDVKPAEKIEFPKAHPVATFTTFDGTAVSAELAKIGDKHWIRISAEQVEQRPAGDEKQPEQDGAAGAEESAEDAKRTAGPEIAAAAINDRVEGWAYQISPYVYDRLTQTIDDLLKPKDDGTS